MNYGLLSLLNFVSYCPLSLAGEVCVWVEVVLSNDFKHRIDLKTANNRDSTP